MRQIPGRQPPGSRVVERCGTVSFITLWVTFNIVRRVAKTLGIRLRWLRPASAPRLARRSAKTHAPFSLRTRWLVINSLLLIHFLPRAPWPRALILYVAFTCLFTLQPETVKSVRREASAVAGHCGRSECREQVSPEVARLPLGADDVRVAHEGEHIGAEVRVLVQAGVRQVVQLRRQQRLQCQRKAGALGQQLSTPPLPPSPLLLRYSSPLACSPTTYLTYHAPALPGPR